MNTVRSENGVSRREKDGDAAASSDASSPDEVVITPPPSSHWTLMVVFFSLLVDLLGFTVILPLIPSMLEYYSKNDKVRIQFPMLSCSVTLAPLTLVAGCLFLCKSNQLFVRPAFRSFHKPEPWIHMSEQD